MSGTMIGLIGFGCLLGMLALRVHIAVAMFIIGSGVYIVMNQGDFNTLFYTLNNMIFFDGLLYESHNRAKLIDHN